VEYGADFVVGEAVWLEAVLDTDLWLGPASVHDTNSRLELVSALDTRL